MMKLSMSLSEPVRKAKIKKCEKTMVLKVKKALTTWLQGIVQLPVNASFAISTRTNTVNSTIVLNLWSKCALSVPSYGGVKKLTVITSWIIVVEPNTPVLYPWFKVWNSKKHQKLELLKTCSKMILTLSTKDAFKKKEMYFFLWLVRSRIGNWFSKTIRWTVDIAWHLQRSGKLLECLKSTWCILTTVVLMMESLRAYSLASSRRSAYIYSTTKRISLGRYHWKPSSHL